jgi:hypothetical protein
LLREHFYHWIQQGIAYATSMMLEIFLSDVDDQSLNYFVERKLDDPEHIKIPDTEGGRIVRPFRLSNYEKILSPQAMYLPPALDVKHWSLVSIWRLPQAQLFGILADPLRIWIKAYVISIRDQNSHQFQLDPDHTFHLPAQVRTNTYLMR